MGSVGSLLPYRPPRAREETTAFVGMVIFLASWAMMFAALFFAYAFVRTHATSWPPVGVPRLPWILPGLNTALLALSSGLLQWAVVRLQRGLPATRLLLATIGLGALFLALQLFVWTTLHAAGLNMQAGGPYASVFYSLTGFHALHVAVGLVGLGSVWRKAAAGRLGAARQLPLRLWTMYWHFVGIIWALMFVSIFLM